MVPLDSDGPANVVTVISSPALAILMPAAAKTARTRANIVFMEHPFRRRRA
jgi:hypothetical protein